MQRAWQTPHGARPNRKGPGFAWETCRLGASQPSGRSLEPRSNARPRGMTVPPQGGQNSAYRSGCHKLIVVIYLLYWRYALGPIRTVNNPPVLRGANTLSPLQNAYRSAN